METKKHFLFVCLSLLIFQTKAFPLDPTPYTSQANEWIKTYIIDGKHLAVAAEDFQLITNLCYFSLQRSINTLESQKQAIKALTIVWEGWQNIAQRRLNPSKEQPYQIKKSDRTQIIDLFWKLHDAHQEIGTIYTHAVNFIVHGDALTTAKAIKSINALRSKAQEVIAQSLSDVRSYLGELFYVPKKLQVAQETINDIEHIVKKGFSIFDHIWSYIPQLAVYSFIKADELNNTVSEEGWHTLKTIQDVGIKTWKAIETARASFYLAHYKALMNLIENIDLDEKYKTITFDLSGLLPTQKRGCLLPKIID